MSEQIASTSENERKQQFCLLLTAVRLNIKPTWFSDSLYAFDHDKSNYFGFSSIIKAISSNCMFLKCLLWLPFTGNGKAIRNIIPNDVKVQR